MIFPKKWYYFGKNSLLPNQCPTKQMQYGRSGSVRVGRGFDSPLVQCRSVSCVWACVVWVSPVGLSWINWAFVLRFRSSACTACVYHSFECSFGPTVARSISPASVALSFYVSVLLNVPHASITLLSALLAPLSLGRSFSSIRKRVFWELWFCVLCSSVALLWICCCCCRCRCYCRCCCFVVVIITIWPDPERVRVVSRGQFSQKSATFLGKLVLLFWENWRIQT